ncbi:DNA cytosine methyltransferase [Amycolatopsis keratiniphila]|uniref:DNA (cytosine-5-)-methyltransferase n=1 Tax=Amycolatopsis keratiniphila subsp. keratiniphila TaxID=227715 RepID=A0A1W2LRF5_9PSEU|nr:DNA (cytosine-5-)-methyltransferase [Amycolatopsis keratiniphila]ONF66911.1 DNA (cytosine-5-)-methyltransferase [Amycolatopsis keratiniphila subsp. keratiniphila]
MKLNAVEICAGAGGQALGLHKAGFHHTLAVELDQNASKTLKTNSDLKNSGFSLDEVKTGDVADPGIWKPHEYKGIDLLAGGVPCPPFTIAGKQLGANDERDLFAWTVEQVATVEPRALLLENVRGLSMPRFAGYRQHVLDRLTTLGYVAEWRLIHASDFNVPQLRPRFVLVALQEKYAGYFRWPKPLLNAPTVGESLKDLMGTRGWGQIDDWVERANKIAPTIVGGSKKHGGADLGPTRAKRAWHELWVDAHGVANDVPGPKDEYSLDGRGPKLTNEMVARLQGFPDEGKWIFEGPKTSKYRQIGNAFPPPVAEAVGKAIKNALGKKGEAVARKPVEHDPIYKVLKEVGDFVKVESLQTAGDKPLEISEVELSISRLGKDFNIETFSDNGVTKYKLGSFKAFTGQDDHDRHAMFLKSRAKIS